MKSVRVAVVGAGYLGRFHAEKYARMPDVTLVGVADVNPQRAAVVARETGSRPFTDYTRLIGRVDAVSVVVPTPLHFAVSRDFLANQVDVFIEKPITTDLDEADELIRLAAAGGRLIQVGHLERFNPALLAAGGMLQRPRCIETRRMSPFRKRGTEVSVVLDLMIHDIDIVQSFLAAAPVEVQADGMRLMSPRIDWAHARLRFADGCVAHLSASRIAADSQRRMTLLQDAHCLTIDFAAHETVIVKRPAAGGIPESAPPEIKRFPPGDALYDELAAFMAAVRQRTRPVVTGEMGRLALKTALQIMACIQAGEDRGTGDTDGNAAG